MSESATKVVMHMRPVDGGRATIGSIDCPYCGREHFTTQIRCGEIEVFCGSKGESKAGWHKVDVQTIT